MFGEGEWWESRITVLLGTGRNLRPVQGLDLGAGAAEHEILWEPLGVALDLFVEPIGCYAVESCQLDIEDELRDLATSNNRGTIAAPRPFGGSCRFVVLICDWVLRYCGRTASLP
jgi:hypothetical protein